MKLSDVKRQALEPFDSLSLTSRYFAAVKSMDAGVAKSRKAGVSSVMKLWGEDGALRITGPEPIGDRSYATPEEILGFYKNRGHGIDKLISANVSQVRVANAKSAEHVTISGTRYVVNTRGEGLQVPFTHNFEIRDGLIRSLHINIGKPNASEVAPQGALNIEDMGRLAAMAWMVA